ncbi:hypothetical protein [Capnocytophaga leadbetteri]|nr:hypothetical protein [Capnocytophaga leadbetteri]
MIQKIKDFFSTEYELKFKMKFSIGSLLIVLLVIAIGLWFLLN